MRVNERIVSGLSSRAKFFLKYVAYAVPAWIVAALLKDLFSLGNGADFLFVCFVLGSIVGGVLSLANLFFGDPAQTVRRQLLHPETILGLVAGMLIGYGPFTLEDSAHATGLTLGAFLIVALLPAALLVIICGVAIIVWTNYPRLGSFVTGGGIGVLGAIGGFGY